MARPRLELHEIFCEVLGSDQCYYSPPASIRMKYPCIRYQVENIQNDYANNQKYISMNRYSGILIGNMGKDWEKLNEIYKKIMSLPYSSSGRTYYSDNLAHLPFTIFF